MHCGSCDSYTVTLPIISNSVGNVLFKFIPIKDPSKRYRIEALVTLKDKLLSKAQIVIALYVIGLNIRVYYGHEKVPTYNNVLTKQSEG